MRRDEANEALGLQSEIGPAGIEAQPADRVFTDGRVDRSGPAGGTTQTERDVADTEDEILRPDPIAVVRAFMAEKGIAVLFDGALQFETAPRMAYCRTDIAGWLAWPEISAEWLIDEIMHAVRLGGIALTTGDIERAVRKISREDRQNRRNLIVEPLLKARPDLSDREMAETAWEKLVAIAFETPAPLAIAVLKQFIWQVKQKLLGRPVRHHLMPVVFSPAQGGGKTTFVLKFLSPLRELATGPVLLSDFADRRSADIYRFPAVFIDDVERIDPRLVPILKSVVTSETFRRRRLGSSRTDGIRQLATLIGTANQPIDVLIADETGHRRFLAMPFRNGKCATGGDESVWEIVNSTDYDLLWRTVDAFGPSPLEPHLDDLATLQGGARRDALKQWLEELDVDAEPVVAITTRYGVRAKSLWELFCEETGSTMTMTRFGTDMACHVMDPAIPFRTKVQTMEGRMYPLKMPVRGPAPAAPTTAS